jgi:hypothetical protein
MNLPRGQTMAEFERDDEPGRALKQRTSLIGARMGLQKCIDRHFAKLRIRKNQAWINEICLGEGDD